MPTGNCANERSAALPLVAGARVIAQSTFDQSGRRSFEGIRNLRDVRVMLLRVMAPVVAYGRADLKQMRRVGAAHR